ncbi:MAG: DciA family protein [Tepidisphaerales bacterium]
MQKLQKKFGRLADVWGALVPVLLQEHTALESFNRGTLTVLVDSSAHLYDLKQLLLAGLEKQFLSACKAQGLRKIALKSGRWYEEQGGEKRVRFDL